MDKRIFNNTRHLNSFVLNRVPYGKKGSFPIDQTPAKPFNIDPDTGRVMTDIQRLIKMQDAVAQQAFFAQLPEFKSNFLPSDMSDEEAVGFIKSRHLQTKSEILDYKEGLAKRALEKDARKKRDHDAKLMDEAVLNFINSSSSSVKSDKVDSKSN